MPVTVLSICFLTQLVILTHIHTHSLTNSLHPSESMHAYSYTRITFCISLITHLRIQVHGTLTKSGFDCMDCAVDVIINAYVKCTWKICGSAGCIVRFHLYTFPHANSSSRYSDVYEYIFGWPWIMISFLTHTHIAVWSIHIGVPCDFDLPD